MAKASIEYKELQKMLKSLPSDKLKEVLDFVQFLKTKEMIDPSQAYFWTKKWQQMEKEAEEDIKKGRVHPYPSVDALKKKIENGD